jgi:predicted GH43/DUF377 family glycosyl hydrolase
MTGDVAVDMDAQAVAPVPIERLDVELRPDSGRVIVRPFLPNEQFLPDDGLLARILALPESEVPGILKAARAKFEDRHMNLEAVLDSHFQYVTRSTTACSELSKERQLLVGAYFTQEFSIETAALTNPSIVAHPDQTGLDPGALRFILSLRSIGEGHLSSIDFRTGISDVSGAITLDSPSRYAVTGTHCPSVFDKASFHEKLVEMDAFDSTTMLVTDLLADSFELHELDEAIATVEGKRAPCRLTEMATKAMHWLATSNYRVTFDPESRLSERVIFPWSPIESHGLEDARFVRFTEDDGSVIYYATYTAYDGFRVLPLMMATSDFVTFDVCTLSGACAMNKGAALFPRRIGGKYAALSRYDGESNYVMTSDNVRIWDLADKIGSPGLPWELARAGNCGSPIETEAGWLVITHGVGPFRVYSLGAILLDIDDPTRIIGRLDEPLLTVTEEEREGYVPNVVYSCGSMIHGDDLLLPHGVTDTTSRIARVPIKALLAKLVG